MDDARESRSGNAPINWLVVVALGLFHLGAIAAFFMFDWTALAVAVSLYWLAGSLGIGMGYHRLLTHRGYKTPKAVEYGLTVLGSLAMEGGPIDWVVTHRVHHAYSDRQGDPHSPRDGRWWAHMGWLLVGQAQAHPEPVKRRFAPDLVKDPIHCWINRLLCPASGSTRAAASRAWRLAIRDVGPVLANGSWTARYMAGELRDSPVGDASLCYPRRFAQQLVGGDAHLWRRLAQQPPCPSGLGSPRTGLVRNRSQLVGYPNASAVWVGKVCSVDSHQRSDSSS